MLRRSLQYFLILAVCLLMPGCRYSNYGVASDNSNIKYPSRYSADKDREYQFYTTLFLDPDLVEGFHVEIRHMFKPHADRKGNFVSEISFWGADLRKDVRVGLDSVQLIHKESDAEVIEAKNTISNLPESGKIPKDKVRIFHYKNIYASNLPKRLMECITFDLEIDGDRYEFHYEFPLEYHLEYAFLDVMMGV